MPGDLDPMILKLKIWDGTTIVLVDANGNMRVIGTYDQDIKDALERIDNQEDEIPYVTVNKTGTDGDIIATPGAGHHLRIHHIYCNNWDNNDTWFHVRNGSGGTPYFPFYLAAARGAVAQNFKRPWGLSENTALYYDHIGGTTPNFYITIGYEDITD